MVYRTFFKKEELSIQAPAVITTDHFTLVTMH